MESILTDREIELIDIVDSTDPKLVIEEIKNIYYSILSSSNIQIIEKPFVDIVNLFNGKYKGYKKCMTEYHNLDHTMDTFLAMARLVHGYYHAL